MTLNFPVSEDSLVAPVSARHLSNTTTCRIAVIFHHYLDYGLFQCPIEVTLYNLTEGIFVAIELVGD